MDIGLQYDTDVLIVGAGPAGSIAAAEIAREGNSVLLVEKSTYPGETSICGGGVDKNSVKHLDLPEKIVEKKIYLARYYFPAQVFSRPALGLSVQRNVFDKFLAERAKKQGAKLAISTIAMNVTRYKDKIVLFLRNCATNESYQVNAKLVIFADGPSTLASKKFDNLGFVRKPTNTALAAVYEIEWNRNPCNAFEFFFDTAISTWGYGWIFPKKNLVNVGVMSLMSKMSANVRTLLDFLVDQHPIASKNLHGKRKLQFRVDIIPLQHAKKIHAHRILVIGDAAGMVDSIGGAGISYAIRGSEIAANVAKKALEKNQFDEKTLSAFERQWKEDAHYKYLSRQYSLFRRYIAYSRFNKCAYFNLVKRDLRQKKGHPEQ